MSPGATGRGAPLADPPREAWVELFRLRAEVIRETERRLREAELPPLAWYDVLYTLYLADEACITQRQLAERITISPSGLSRLIDRMVARGVVLRELAPDDRRAASLKLTEQGIELMRSIWRIYGGLVAEHFAPAVAGHEAKLAQMLREARRSLHPEIPPLRSERG